jgi:hypothetical protein
MSDRNRPLNRATLDLAEALRALPLQSPDRSAWPELAQKLRRESLVEDRESKRSERIRRFIVPAALAAALAGVFIVAHHARDSRDPISGSATATVSAPAASSNTNSAQVVNVHNAASHPEHLVALQQRSQALESWLRETGGAAAPLQGQDLAAATEIENLIGLVDVELSAPRETSDANLWQRRVALLEDLSALRYSNYQLAAGGRFTAASLTN